MLILKRLTSDPSSILGGKPARTVGDVERWGKENLKIDLWASGEDVYTSIHVYL